MLELLLVAILITLRGGGWFVKGALWVVLVLASILVALGILLRIGFWLLVKMLRPLQAWEARSWARARGGAITRHDSNPIPSHSIRPRSLTVPVPGLSRRPRLPSRIRARRSHLGGAL